MDSTVGLPPSLAAIVPTGAARTATDEAIG
jgi:hypothetical protein